MVNVKVKFLLLGVAAVSVSVAPTLAQTADTAAVVEDYYSRNKYVAVTDRPQEEFDPVPMRWGSFFVQPKLGLSAAADSNLFASSGEEKSDVIAQIGASLDARSNWNNHSLQFSVSGRQNEYMDVSSESNFDFRSRVKGQLDVSRAFALLGEAYYEDRTEERTQIANRVTNVRPIQFEIAGAKAGLGYKNGRTRLAANLHVQQRDYDDGRDVNGLEFDQDFRDRNITTAVVSATYAITPNLAVFGQGRTTEREYDFPTIIDGVEFNRDSSGYDIQGGVDFELNSLLRGNLGVGYLEEDRDDERFQDIDGLSVDGLVQWFPTQIVTVTGTAARRSVDQGLIEEPSAIATKVGLLVDYEVRRNLILSVAGEVSSLDFDSSDRSEDLLNFSLSATYKLNRRAELEAFARIVDRDTSGFTNAVGAPFEKNVVGVGINLYPF